MLVDPHPHAPWPATYGLWADECGLLPHGSRWVGPVGAHAVATTAHTVARDYAVLDNESVRSALTRSDVLVVADSVLTASHGNRGTSVRLASGRVVAAATVIDATGPRRVLCGGPVSGPRAEQSAFGVILPLGSAAPLVTADTAVVMDWTPPPGFAGRWPTFLYTVPLPGRQVLVEETSLARRPPLGLAELRARLAARLAGHGLGLAGRATERVRIPLDLPIPGRARGTVAFGAAAAMVHPASGYSLADTFRLALPVAEAIRTELPRGPDAAARAARQVLWPASARAVHRLRRAGLRAVLRLPPRQIAAFFELFFSLPPDLQRAYLSARTDLAGTAAAMAGLFRAADLTMRRAIVTGMLTPRWPW